MLDFGVIFPFLGEGVAERRIEYRMWSHAQATAIQPDDTTTCMCVSFMRKKIGSGPVQKRGESGRDRRRKRRLSRLNSVQARPLSTETLWHGSELGPELATV